MARLIGALTSLHASLARVIEGIGDRGLIGLAARFVFAAVLLRYFLNSWATKVEGGLTGFLAVRDSAYYQIVPWAVDAAGGEISAIGLFDRFIVHAGTYAELLLPLLILVGLFTRLAALGMIVFIAVQSFVDVTFHGVSGDTVGSLFDRFPDALVVDQRTLWVFLLAMLVVKGGGYLSLDRLFAGRPATGPQAGDSPAPMAARGATGMR